MYVMCDDKCEHGNFHIRPLQINFVSRPCPGHIYMWAGSPFPLFNYEIGSFSWIHTAISNSLIPFIFYARIIKMSLSIMTHELTTLKD